MLAFSMVFASIALVPVGTGNIAEAAKKTLTDVSNSYAKAEIEALTDAGVIGGYEDGSFMPTKAMSRAELAKIIVLSAGLQENADKAATFTDVSSNAWYRCYVGALVASGITQGVTPTRFAPDAPVTREELVVFFIRALGLEEKASKIAIDTKLSDMDSVSSWAKADVSLGFKLGFVKGIDDGEGTLRFSPKDSAERQALARLAYEFSKNKSALVAKAETLFPDTAEVSNITITGFTSTSNTTVEVTFEKAISNVIATDFTFDGGLTVVNASLKAGYDKVVVLTTSSQTGGTIYKLSYKGVDTGKTLTGTAVGTVSGGSSSSSDSSDSPSTQVFNTAGVYGPSSGTQTLTGDVRIASKNVILKNTIVTGNLVIGEEVGDGDVTLDNVQVRGVTTVSGGGKNSIHLNNTVLVSVIVNRATGVVRLVAEGTTTVQQVTLQSSAILEEFGATGTGFSNVTVSNSMPANSSVSLVGIFETVDVYASNFVVQLGDETQLSNLVLNAATSVLGNGVIQNATINTNQALFERSPNNVTVGAGGEIPTVVGRRIGFEGNIEDVNGAPVSGLEIKFRRGIGSTVGQVVYEVMTDTNGRYAVKLPFGSYTGELIKDGFIVTYVVGISAENVYNMHEDATAIRIPNADEVRIVLTWGENPRDLDSHLVGPTVNGNGFHTWYANRVNSNNELTYADLDLDDTSSYGPETTTIRKTVDGKYRFYIHHFSGSSTLRTSGAEVKVFSGDSATPVKSYVVPAGTGKELYWAVFDMDVNGSNVTYTEVNQLFASEADARGPLNFIATLVSNIYVVNDTANTIRNVAHGTAVEAFKTNVTLPAGATMEGYESNGTTIKTGAMVTGDKVIVTAANGITKKTYTVTVNPPITVTGLVYNDFVNTLVSSPVQLQASAQTSEGQITDVSNLATWTAINPSIGTVSTTGLFTPVSSGTTVVTATYAGLTAAFNVSVYLQSTVSMVVYGLTTSLDRGVTASVYGAVYNDGSNTVVIPNNKVNTFVMLSFSDTLANDGLTLTGINLIPSTLTISKAGITPVSVTGSVYSDGKSLVFDGNSLNVAGTYLLNVIALTKDQSTQKIYGKALQITVIRE
ncbi:S-layer homology domain-containing protein [Paenibacillus alba]|uniref:S-layer homology domain-containing protein n=1 Tax=Paenibacillus alba TaxID=1197127 RepID=A0ABU6GEV1_9BACL|nr:S-layer homology domain-containing protein [Paenibacillus alba]MEC0231204.1 S-layer homology domain-containing protein [Paenibacillus alba]